MSAITVRRADANDVAGVLDCLRCAFEPYRGSYTPTAFEDTVMSPETIRNRFNAMVVFVGVTAQGEIAGTIGCQVVRADEGHVRGMAVRPDQSGTGLAGRLLDVVETELRQAGCSRLTLDTTEPLHRAIRFYERHGFHRSGTVRNFFGMRLIEYTKAL